MALPDSFDEFTASLERELDRNVTEMDYIKAMYVEVVAEQNRIEGVAKAASGVTQQEA